MIYEHWLKEWLENYVKPASKQKTYFRYTEIVYKHIVQRLGKYEMDELSPLILQHFTTELLKNGNLRTGNGLSANSVNCIVTVLQNSLKSAYSVELVSEYRADRIKRPKIKEKQVTCFTKNEQKKLEQVALNDLYNKKPRSFGILLSMYTGLRIGELLALEWKDIDFKKGRISVSKACHDAYDGNGHFFRVTETPKTDASKRIIPIPKQIVPYLREVQKINKSNFVIASRDGKPVSTRGYQRSFELTLIKLNIPHRGFHALRHTFATRALECGMDVKTLSEILGHKSPTVTLNRYVHSLMEHKTEMMNKLGKLL